MFYAANFLLSDFAQLDVLKEVYDKVTIVHEESGEHAGPWNRNRLNCLRCKNDPYGERHAFILMTMNTGIPIFPVILNHCAVDFLSILGIFRSFYMFHAISHDITGLRETSGILRKSVFRDKKDRVISSL